MGLVETIIAGLVVTTTSGLVVMAFKYQKSFKKLINLIFPSIIIILFLCVIYFWAILHVNLKTIDEQIRKSSDITLAEVDYSIYENYKNLRIIEKLISTQFILIIFIVILMYLPEIVDFEKK